ncbi:hypothetical protein C8J57DRAFT_652996 [Mycena rebaudengoi]|nr:hypothetical protein C8J57DRAFT_652996 [Mycena rebaudengoi]
MGMKFKPENWFFTPVHNFLAKSKDDDGFIQRLSLKNLCMARRRLLLPSFLVPQSLNPSLKASKSPDSRWRFKQTPVCPMSAVRTPQTPCLQLFKKARLNGEVVQEHRSSLRRRKTAKWRLCSNLPRYLCVDCPHTCHMKRFTRLLPRRGFLDFRFKPSKLQDYKTSKDYQLGDKESQDLFLLLAQECKYASIFRCPITISTVALGASIF